MTADDRTPATLAAASRRAITHYRVKAAQCRADAARWDALADELEAFGETSDHHEGQGELL